LTTGAFRAILCRSPSHPDEAGMPVLVSCPHCGQQGDVSRAAAGHQVTCAGCDRPFDVPPGSGQLTVEWGVGRVGRRAPLTPGKALRIGRAADNELVLPEARVSRHHAEIRWEHDEWRIYDLESGNGTVVDGNPITAASLQTGRRITIGDYTIRVTIAGHAGEDDSQLLDGAHEQVSSYGGPGTMLRPVAAAPEASGVDQAAASADDTMLEGPALEASSEPMDASTARHDADGGASAPHRKRTPGPLVIMIVILGLLVIAAAVLYGLLKS
ncbi:MAG: FHA domain-containing protein, partial [Phycisphaerae bacterium]